MAFIEVVTRCYRRPEMLAKNQESLNRQTFSDWEQTLLIDEAGMGLDEANRQLTDFVPEGEYVWILDDDDMAIRDALFQEVYDLVKQTQAKMVMVRMDHGVRGVLPNGMSWGSHPIVGRAGVSSAFIARQVWLDAAPAWDRDGYDTDGHFIWKAFYQAGHVAWHDVIGSRVQRISMGATE